MYKNPHAIHVRVVPELVMGIGWAPAELVFNGWRCLAEFVAL